MKNSKFIKNNEGDDQSALKYNQDCDLKTPRYNNSRNHSAKKLKIPSQFMEPEEEQADKNGLIEVVNVQITDDELYSGQMLNG